MKILKDGGSWKELAGWRCKCWRCGCKFELENGEEEREIYGDYFVCPHCGDTRYMEFYNSRKIWKVRNA